MKQCWNKTKIVATIGPACSHPQILRNMLRYGLDIARFNFSHGSIKTHSDNIKILRDISRQMSLPLAIMADLPGPKMRIGDLAQPFVILKRGQRFTLTRDRIIGSEKQAGVNYPALIRDIKINEIVYLSDGQIRLRAIDKDEKRVIFQVLAGGRLYSRKGLNAPETRLSIPVPTSRDREIIRAALGMDVDFIAVSFVSCPEEILSVKKLISRGKNKIQVIAKIEKRESLKNIDTIIKVSDAVMVARGDLGVEIPLEEVPYTQKLIIKKCNQAGKAVITATQMLESMVEAIEPTRAEVTDVANAVYDGSDAVMLSEETAAGKYPVEAVRMMARIARQAEKDYLPPLSLPREHSETAAVGLAACALARNLNARLIIVPTISGRTARLISNLRPQVPVLALTPDESVMRRLMLYWGVYPQRINKFRDFNEMAEYSLKLARRIKLVKKNEKIVLTAGMLGKTGRTDMLQVITCK